MKTLSLKLQEPLYDELEVLAAQLRRSRNSYINEAIAFYNKLQRRELLAQELAAECALVREADYAILKEMENMEDPID